MSSSSDSDSSSPVQDFYIQKDNKKAFLVALKELAARKQALRGVAYAGVERSGRRRNSEERREARADFWGGFMAELDKILRAMCEKEGLSKTKLRALVVSKGICLTNGVEYGK